MAKHARKFNRTMGRRKSFLQGLANNLIMKERISTTVARAKEIRPMVERMVTIAKKQEVVSLRRLLAALPKQSANKIYYEIAARYQTRAGGYLRITKLAKARKRDASPMAVIEFVK